MPAISIRCPGCKHRLAAPPEAAGRSLPCPHCRAAVTVPADSNATLVDENAPDFSYLRNQPEPDDDILVAEDLEDGESALGQSTARRPAPTATSKTTAVVPPPVIYTPPAVEARPPTPPDNPFAQLSGAPSSKRKATPLPSPAEPDDPPKQAKEKPRDRRPEPDPDRKPHRDPPARTPKWVWPVLIALAVYAFVATGLGAWGWLRPVAPAAAPTKTAR